MGVQGPRDVTVVELSNVGSGRRNGRGTARYFLHAYWRNDADGGGGVYVFVAFE